MAQDDGLKEALGFAAALFLGYAFLRAITDVQCASCGAYNAQSSERCRSCGRFLPRGG